MTSHTIISYALLATYICVVAATDYTVGDSDGWAIGTNYLAWASKYNFTKGDALIFTYVKGQHDVYEVTQDSFRSCNATNGTLHIYNSGIDTVNLTRATEYWFLCNIKDHCIGGMKFTINVSEPPTPPPTQPPPPAVTLPPPPPPNAAVRGDMNRWYFVILIICGFFLFVDLFFYFSLLGL
ncbi:Blue copper protein [Rhynchospora pubera]|uniref:Blue copper protein n=1 Tax=Rhynchospora pubera TaxID=906938 RepID=A0AAV8E9B2_9POAL|nr:Blue copper protein [Rhynchospora pubera]